jgi:hypothetical protein
MSTQSINALGCHGMRPPIPHLSWTHFILMMMVALPNKEHMRVSYKRWTKDTTSHKVIARTERYEGFVTLRPPSRKGSTRSGLADTHFTARCPRYIDFVLKSPSARFTNSKPRSSPNYEGPTTKTSCRTDLNRSLARATRYTPVTALGRQNKTGLLGVADACPVYICAHVPGKPPISSYENSAPFDMNTPRQPTRNSKC